MRNTNRFARMIVTVAIIASIVALCTKKVDAKEYKLSCYCPESCPGTVTATGSKVREGIIAGCEAHLGDAAMIYTLDGEFIGYYECLDTGGAKGIKNDKVIDMWMPNLDKAWDMVHRTGGKIIVEWYPRVKG